MERIVERIYTVHFLNQNDQPDTGKDIIQLKINGRKQYVWTVNTHDGLFVEYDHTGRIVKWLKPRA